MTMSVTRHALLLPAFWAAAAAAQPASDLDCDNDWRGWRNRAHVCEVREITVRATGTLAINATPNGGIEVIGADRNDVLVRARVVAWGDDEDAARALAGAVAIRTDDVIQADGPENRDRHSWTVSYEVLAPRDTDLRLETLNGGIAVTNLRGNIDLAATNGGLQLDGLAGNVRARTTNGGVEARLTGARWDGDALNLQSTNGGIRLRVPEDYSARVEARTTNGGVNIDFPVTVQGRLGRELNTTLGDGGALVRAQTTNGGVRISKY